MSTASILFNGLHFQPTVADNAFKRAKQSGYSVQAIFLKCKNEKEEGYGFPSDMDAAETLATGKEADADDHAIIESYIRMLEHQAAGEKIAFNAQVLQDPSLEQFQVALQGSVIIFMQQTNNNNDTIPAAIDLQKLLREINIPLEIVQ